MEKFDKARLIELVDKIKCANKELPVFYLSKSLWDNYYEWQKILSNKLLFNMVDDLKY